MLRFLALKGMKWKENNMEIKNRLFYQNGRPFFPVMGEFQYSRTFLGDWDTDLKKMKALGINTVATYVFWIHHEESEGEFDFSGNRNIRLFLELCQKRNQILYYSSLIY